MFDNVTIGDRIKLEHIKSNSFIDSVVTDYDQDEGRWVEIPGNLPIYITDGWERVG